MSFFITIAVPTYNNEATIRNAIDSCLNQSEVDYSFYEILIVNNASTDGTPNILKDYESRSNVRVVHNQKTCSLFENHNVCLREAKGRYVLFCHSDDTLDYRAIEIVKNKIYSRGSPEKYVLWGHSLFRDFSPNLITSGMRVGEMFAGEVAVKPFILGGLTPSGTCYSKKFIEYGGFVSTNLRLSPSDSSSMVWLALNGFRFEMMEDIIFARKGASTLVKGTSVNIYLEAYKDAYLELSKKLNKDVLNNVFIQALKLNASVLHFYYFYADINSAAVLKAMIKGGIKKPTCLMRSLYWKIILYALFKRKQK